MRSFKSYGTIILILVLAFSFSITYAGDETGKSAKNVKAANSLKKAMAKADEKDWVVFAKAAQFCINRNIILEEALEWIDHSLDVEQKAFNLGVKGDYYFRSGDVESAFEYYSMGIQNAIKERAFLFDKELVDELQRKAILTGRLLKEGDY